MSATGGTVNAIPRGLSVGLRRMSSQTRSALPRLPVPPLRQTLDGYIKSIEPFLLEDEARGGTSFASSYALRVQWANQFENGVGRLCQERLLALDKKSPHNWLNDNIWMKKVYMEWRAPLLINSNWWLLFNNDDGVPEDVLQCRAVENVAGITPWQVRRAASLVRGILNFKERMDSEKSDIGPTGVWLREVTAQMFNVCRVPRLGADTISQVATSPNAGKLLVMVHDWCYTIDVYDAQSNPASTLDIEYRLCQVVRDAAERKKNGEKAVCVSVLTSDGRDQWAKNLRCLLDLSPKNYEVFRTIQDTLFVLCLDHYTHILSPATVPAPIDTPQEVDAHLHNIRSSRDARNRWFDKSLNLIVESNTRAGLMGEHSPCDALVPSIVCEHAIVQNVEWEKEPLLLCMEDVVDVANGWARLDWITDAQIEAECRRAGERAKAIIENSDDSVLWFDEYGADWIKGVAKLSPDAYLQMVLQLAWYRTRGNFTATYETALTRKFAKGRTETIRTLTREVRAWVLDMVNPSCTFLTRRARLRRAIQEHTLLTRQAALGHGIDRHLLGLQLMLAEGEYAPLLEDGLFKQTQRWALSTSGLSAGHLFRGTGFGAILEDGYGINYLAGPDTIKFGIESKRSCPETSTSRFKTAIEEALRDMKATCDASGENEEILSKL